MNLKEWAYGKPPSVRRVLSSRPRPERRVFGVRGQARGFTGVVFSGLGVSGFWIYGLGGFGFRFERILVFLTWE